MLKDYLGRQITRGARVARAARYGSHASMELRTVSTVGEDFVLLNGNHSRVYNVHNLLVVDGNAYPDDTE